MAAEPAAAAAAPAATAAPFRLTGAQRDIARSLLIETREELIRADGKAALLLASVGLAVGAILAELFTGHKSIHVRGAGWEVVWWSGVALGALGTSFLCW